LPLFYADLPVVIHIALVTDEDLVYMYVCMLFCGQRLDQNISHIAITNHTCCICPTQLRILLKLPLSVTS
jgi:hypothetical protein